ncbi:MAG: hypothetical protein ABEJ72_09420 [Candidatus Aenigmatarchaeota archaeon]
MVEYKLYNPGTPGYMKIESMMSKQGISYTRGGSREDVDEDVPVLGIYNELLEEERFIEGLDQIQEFLEKQ